MLTSEKLVLIREKIEKPENWCRGHWCVYTDNVGGRAFCLIGATSVVGNAEDARKILIQITAELTNQTPPAYNDSHTHAEVLAVVDRAIEIAKAQESEFEESAVETKVLLPA